MSKIRWKSLNKKSSFKWALLVTLLLPFAALLNNHQAQALPANYNMGDFKNLAFHAPLTSNASDTYGHPATFSRSTTATQSVTDETCSTTTLSTVAAGTLRIDCACDKNGERICGARVEPAATNLALYSEQADNAAWATTAVVTADAATAPDGNATADHIVATADSHLQTVTVTASIAYTCSVYIKAASAITVPVQCDDTTTNCSVGTSWTRCESRDASAATTSLSVGLGTGTYTVDWFGAQLEAGAVATSYVPTTTAAVTRAADRLFWAFAAPSTGTIRYRLLVPDFNNSTDFIYSLSDGTSSNRIQTYMYSSTDAPRFVALASSVIVFDILGTTDISSNQVFTLHQRWSSTNNDQFVDRVREGTPDTSATIPTTTTLYLGSQNGGITAPMLISDIRVYSKQRTPRVVPVFHAPLTTDAADLFGHPATFSRSTTATQSVTDATCTTTTLSTVAINTLRIDCACDSSSNRLCGARVEPSATNLVLYSESILLWGGANFTKSLDATTAPDGSMTADLLSETVDASSVEHIIYSSDPGSQSAGDVRTFSVYLKATTRHWVYLINRLNTDATVTFNGAYFDLSAGTIGTVDSGVTASIQDVGDGWFRCSITETDTAGSTAQAYARITISTGDGVRLYTGDGSSGIYIWGAQVETGAVATSYIPTTTATVTRAADSLSWAFAAPSTGTIRYRLLMPDYASAQEYIISMSDGTASNEILTYQHNDEVPAIYMLNGGAVQVFIKGATDLTSNTALTFHAQWSSTNNDLFIDRAQEGIPDTSATIPTMTMLRIGYSANGAITAPILISDLRVDNGQVLR